MEKKKLAQWFLRITHYAPDLLVALDRMARWPERVRLMQAKWIGRSEGARVRFELNQQCADITQVEVFTTRPDTLFGMSFLALAPEHPLAACLAERDPQAAAFIAGCSGSSTAGRAAPDERTVVRTVGGVRRAIWTRNSWSTSYWSWRGTSRKLSFALARRGITALRPGPRYPPEMPLTVSAGRTVNRSYRE